MQIRCRHCNRPYALKRDNVHAALERMLAEDLQHYNVQCPHCGKNNRVSRKQLRRAARIVAYRPGRGKFGYSGRVRSGKRVPHKQSGRSSESS